MFAIKCFLKNANVLYRSFKQLHSLAFTTHTKYFQLKIAVLMPSITKNTSAVQIIKAHGHFLWDYSNHSKFLTQISLH